MNGRARYLLHGDVVLYLIVSPLLDPLDLHDVLRLLIRPPVNNRLGFHRSNLREGIQFLFAGGVDVNLLPGSQLRD